MLLRVFFAGRGCLLLVGAVACAVFVVCCLLVVVVAGCSWCVCCVLQLLVSLCVVGVLVIALWGVLFAMCCFLVALWLLYGCSMVAGYCLLFVG